MLVPVFGTAIPHLCAQVTNGLTSHTPCRPTPAAWLLTSPAELLGSSDQDDGGSLPSTSSVTKAATGGDAAALLRSLILASGHMDASHLVSQPVSELVSEGSLTCTSGALYSWWVAAAQQGPCVQCHALLYQVRADVAHEHHQLHPAPHLHHLLYSKSPTPPPPHVVLSQVRGLDAAYQQDPAATSQALRQALGMASSKGFGLQAAQAAGAAMHAKGEEGIALAPLPLHALATGHAAWNS
jgi:hypothetical protein